GAAASGDESRRRPAGSLPPSKPPPARHRPGARSARRPRCLSLAGQKETTMRRLSWKPMLAVALAVGGFAIGIAWATPSRGVTTTIIVGPVPLGEGKVKSESDVNEVEFEAKGASDLYVVYNKIVPGGHTGWHSHPGISF